MNPIQLLIICIASNHEDIIEVFLRHHAAIADCIVVLINGSADSTRSICLDTARDLNNVLVTDINLSAEQLNVSVENIASYIQDAYFADTIVFLSPTEFIAEGSKYALSSEIENIGVGSVFCSPIRVLPARRKVKSPIDQARAYWEHGFQDHTQKFFLRLGGMRWSEFFNQFDRSQFNWSTNLKVPIVQFQLQAEEPLDYIAERIGDINFLIGERLDIHEIDVDVDNNTAPTYYAHGLFYLSNFTFEQISAPSHKLKFHARRYQHQNVEDDKQLRHDISEVFKKPDSDADRTCARLVVSPTAFEPEWHWNNLFVDVAPFRYLFEMLRPMSVLDIGCGVGAYLKLFEFLGAKQIFGIDGMDQASTLLRESSYKTFDLSLPLNLTCRFDLVVCVEVVEHLSEVYEEILIDTIASHSKDVILFSAAGLGQPGHNHINMKPLSFWLEQWAKRGWYPDLKTTLAARSVSTLSWFRRNIIVLKTGAKPKNLSDTLQYLVAISGKHFGWYAQEAGVRNLPFSELLPQPPFGYGELLTVGSTGSIRRNEIAKINQLIRVKLETAQIMLSCMEKIRI